MAGTGTIGGFTAMGPVPSDVALGIGSGAGAVAAGNGGVDAPLATRSGAIDSGISTDIGIDGTGSDDHHLAALDAVLAGWDSINGSGVEDGPA